jgi:hypothetical protein
MDTTIIRLLLIAVLGLAVGCSKDKGSNQSHESAQTLAVDQLHDKILETNEELYSKFAIDLEGKYSRRSTIPIRDSNIWYFFSQEDLTAVRQTLKDQIARVDGLGGGTVSLQTVKTRAMEYIASMEAYEGPLKPKGYREKSVESGILALEYPQIATSLRPYGIEIGLIEIAGIVRPEKYKWRARTEDERGFIRSKLERMMSNIKRIREINIELNGEDADPTSSVMLWRAKVQPYLKSLNKFEGRN